MAAETPDSGERIGTVVEKYEILQKVGEGGMATVYRGRHRTLDREVAIKILHPHLSNNVKNRTRFEREARAIESLSCRNIPEIYDFSGPQAEQCFIITEFIHGPTLRTFLEMVDAIPSEPAALIGLQVANALDAAHRRGIVHRDIKPENIMIDGSGTVKLMDFGIARVLDESHVTLTGALVGSPAFMSPEQARDDDIDARSDLFSFGTLLYLMVTGQLPFRGGNPSVVLKGIIEGEYEDPIDHTPDLHPDLVRVIERCLETDPDDRFPDVDAVRAELEAVLRSSAIDPGDPGELWSLASYFEDAVGYERRLREHLVPTLLERGKALIEERNPSEALRHLNRVLTLDEGNPEVLDLIGRLGNPEEEDEGGSWWPYGLTLAGILALVGIGLWWQLWRPGPGPEVDGGAVDGEVATEAGDGLAEDGEREAETAATGDGEQATAEQPTPDEEATAEEPTPEEETTPEQPTPGEEATPEQPTPGDDGSAEVEEFTPPPPPPLERWAGQARIRILTPGTNGVDLYYRDAEGAEPVLLMEECGLWNAGPVPIPAGRLEVFARGPYHETKAMVLELTDQQVYEATWTLDELPAHLYFRGLPEGTTITVDGEVIGRYPGVPRWDIDADREVRVLVRTPDGNERIWNVPKLKPKEGFVCEL